MTVCKWKKRAHIFIYMFSQAQAWRRRDHRYDDGWKWNNGTRDKHDHFLQLYIKLDLWNIILYFGSCACLSLYSLCAIFFVCVFFIVFFVVVVVVCTMMVTFRVLVVHLALSMRFDVIKYDNGSFSVWDNLYWMWTITECELEMKFPTSSLSAVGGWIDLPHSHSINHDSWDLFNFWRMTMRK